MKPYSRTDVIRHIEKKGLYLMNSSNIDRFISCGVDAFRGYNLYDYFFQSKDYDKKLNLIIELLIKENGKAGILYADSEEVNGFAQWYPPGFSGHSLFDHVRCGAWKFFFMEDFFGTFNRMNDYENFASKKKEEFTQNEELFLYLLAVRPLMQKKGISSKLVKPMIEYAKTINRPCFLETHKKQNVGLYEHMGFKLLPCTKTAEKDNYDYFPMIYKVD